MFTFPREGKSWVWKCTSTHRHQGVGALTFYLVKGPLQNRMFQLGCNLFRCYLWVQDPVVLVVWYVLFYKFPELLSLQGASSNFLALRIKAHKTIKVSHAQGSSQLWERGPEKVAFVLLVSTHSNE